jgi:long-chain acyl-CoA synthetase
VTQNARPWLALYDEGKPADIDLEYANALDMFKASVRRSPDSPLVQYMDSTITVAEVDRMSDALAVALVDHGLAAGDRVAVYLQNVPQFLIGMVAI